MIQSAITVSLVPEARGGPFVFWDLPSGCRKAAELGFDAIEIFARSAQELEAQPLEKLLAAHHLKVAAIGTGGGWVAQRLRLTDPETSVRRRTKEFVEAIIEVAAGFGAPAIIGSIQGRWGEGVSREQALAWLAEALEELGPRAQSLRMPLLLKPLNRYETNLFNRVSDTLQFLKKLRAQNIKLVCDLFHLNIEEADLGAALRLAGTKLGHIHFADSNRRAVGLGHTSFDPIVQALNQIRYDGYASAEILPLPDSDTAAWQTIESFRKFFPAINPKIKTYAQTPIDSPED